MRFTVVITAALAATIALPAQRGGGGDRPNAWAQLSKRYDTDKDGKITKKEYTRGERAFGNLDRNGDGEITEADFQRNRGRGNRQRGGGDRSRMISMRIARSADADKSGTVTDEEWKTFVKSLDATDGVISEDAIAGLMPTGTQGGNRQRGSSRMVTMLVQAIDKDSDGKVQVTEIAAMFATLDADNNKTLEAAEMGQRTRGGNRGGQRSRGNRGNRGERGGPALPKAGEVAPDFELPYADDKDKTVKLSSFAGQKPVALIFGSYT